MKEEATGLVPAVLHDQTIRTLSAEERLRLAKLILNDLSPDEATPSQAFPERPGEIRDQDHLEELLLAGLNSGPGIEATPEYWERKRTTLLERLAQRVQEA